MKVIFIGTTDFGIPALEMLEENFNLVGVVTQPDKPVGRKKIITPPPVKTWAERNELPVLQPEKIAEAETQLKNLAPDIFIVAAYGQIIPQNILRIPTKGSINLHSSLLPKYRGASPIQAALLNDDKETGISIMLMDEKMDHGPILSQQTVPIEDSYDYLTLHTKLALVAADLFKQTLPKWLDGSIKPQEQNHDAATFVKTITREDAKIDWTKTARTILQQIKALNPEPGTWTTLDKKSVKIMGAEEVKDSRVELPGKIYASGKDCLVKCGDYSLRLLKVQPEGKNPITGTDFLNGLKQLETKMFV